MPATIDSLPIIRAPRFDPESGELLRINPELVANFLVRFLRDECIRGRGISRAIVGLSGGIDSSVTTYLCARAFGPENTHAFRLPYKVSSPESLSHAREVTDALGVHERTIDITAMADGYLSESEEDASPLRIGNVCARCRITVLFDQSAKLNGLPIGTGNKTERMLGYFTWHADDAPPINPLGDLYKMQVYQLAEYLGVPEAIINKPPTADLLEGQTDEGDIGISYAKADRILVRLLEGHSAERLVELGFEEKEVEIVWKRVSGTHWKRHLPTVALISSSAINEFYLRPVDF
ncbi:MAG: NAD+ synthase [Armatimonadetes bacterium]|nr:NAD+ synthase [Armatimonadota bacterium]